MSQYTDYEEAEEAEEAEDGAIATATKPGTVQEQVAVQLAEKPPRWRLTSDVQLILRCNVLPGQFVNTGQLLQHLQLQDPAPHPQASWYHQDGADVRRLAAVRVPEWDVFVWHVTEAMYPAIREIFTVCGSVLFTQNHHPARVSKCYTQHPDEVLLCREMFDIRTTDARGYIWDYLPVTDPARWKRRRSAILGKRTRETREAKREAARRTDELAELTRRAYIAICETFHASGFALQTIQDFDGLLGPYQLGRKTRKERRRIEADRTAAVLPLRFLTAVQAFRRWFSRSELSLVQVTALHQYVLAYKPVPPGKASKSGPAVTAPQPLLLSWAKRAVPVRRKWEPAVFGRRFAVPPLIKMFPVRSISKGKIQ